jgi:hypothetical protein
VENDQAATQSPEERILAMLDVPEVPETELDPANPDNAAVEGETQAEEEAQPEKEASESVEIDPDAKFIEVEVKTEGGETTTEKLSLNELRAQRMMQADYQRKTQELARQRDEVPDKIRQGIQEQLTKSVQEIQSLQEVLLQAVAPELKGIDFNRLATEDPAEYVRMSNRARQIEQAWQAMERTKQQKVSELTSMNAQQTQKLREEAQTKIKSEIPNYDEIAPALKDTAVKKYGFTADQLESIHHPGFTKLLHDAHEFQKTQSATKTIVEKKVALVPKVLKPGQAKVGDGNRERVTEGMKNLRKTGRVEDAAAVIFHSLK